MSKASDLACQMTCPACGREYSRTSWQAKKRIKMTCSRRCSYILRGRARTTRQTVACAKCGTPFEKQPSAIYSKSFCVECKGSPIVPYPIGHRCGRWTVLAASVVKKGNRYLQLCRCDCGIERLIRKACLNPGVANKSLGCRECARAAQRKLLPKQIVEDQLHAGASTLASIATRLSVSPDVVRKSIEHHRISLPSDFGPRRVSIKKGDKFGKWTALSRPFVKRSPRGIPLKYVRCRCDCGTKKQLRVQHLTGGKSTQCRKCLGKERRAENSPHWKGNEIVSGALVNAFRNGAKSRGLAWDISADDMARLFEQQKCRCALTGVLLSLPSRDYERADGCGIHYQGTASLDRINSAEGYTATNIQWVEKTVNLMKRDFSEEEFVALCRLVAKKKPPALESAQAFEERFLSDLWNPQQREGIYSPHWKGYGAITGAQFRRIRAGAKSRGIAFRLKCSDLWHQFVEQRGLCALSGLPLLLHTKNSDKRWNASLDRIDSQKPYTQNNVWWVDVRLNLLKRELPLDVALDRCKRVARHNKSKGEVSVLTQMTYKHGVRRH
jgi:hypothetical protein